MVEKLRTRKILTILISGKVGVGKTTLANLVLEELTKYTTLLVEVHSFAEKVKSIARTQFGWDDVKDVKGRRLLQLIGTEVGREYNKDIWANYLLDKIESGGHTGLHFPHVVLVDDWRYPNERDILKKSSLLDVVTVRIEAPNREFLRGTLEENHPSEISLPTNRLNYYNGFLFFETDYDFVIDNTKGMKELKANAKSLLKNLATKYFVKE